LGADPGAQLARRTERAALGRSSVVCRHTARGPCSYARGWLACRSVSAVILAVIVVMWAVVLVPMWLRRHDAATESRSVDRFSTAMRILSRRPAATPGSRYVVMPQREASVSVHVSGASAPKPPAGRPA